MALFCFYAPVKYYVYVIDVTQLSFKFVFLFRSHVDDVQHVSLQLEGGTRTPDSPGKYHLLLDFCQVVLF